MSPTQGDVKIASCNVQVPACASSVLLGLLLRAMVLLVLPFAGGCALPSISLDSITPSFLRSDRQSVQENQETKAAELKAAELSTEHDSPERLSGAEISPAGPASTPAGPVNKASHVAHAANQLDDVIKVVASPESALDPRQVITNRNLKRSQGHHSPVMALYGLSAAGAFVSVDSAGLVLLWKNPAEAYELLRLPQAPDVVAFEPKTFTFAWAAGTLITVYPAADTGRAYVLHRMSAKANALDLSPDGRSVLIGATDSRAYRWRYFDEESATTAEEKERCFERYFAHASVLSALRFHPRGRIFFSGDWLGNLNVSLLFDADRFGGQFDENVFEGREFSEKKLTRHSAGRRQGGIALMECTPDGRYLLVGAEDGMIELWQVRGFKSRASVQAYRGTGVDLAVSGDSRLVASISRDGRLLVYEMVNDKADSYQLRQVQELEASGAKALTFLTPEVLAVGFSDGHIERRTITGAATGG